MNSTQNFQPNQSSAPGANLTSNALSRPNMDTNDPSFPKLASSSRINTRSAIKRTSETIIELTIKNCSADSNQFPTNHESVAPKNMYAKHNGPFTVEVDSLSDPPLNSLSVGRILHKSFKDEILDCKKKGPSRTTILCKSAFGANKTVENLEKINSNLKAFIPNFRITRLGIVRNIPLDLLMEDLKEHAISSVLIINAKRFERKDQHGKFIPTSTVFLTFDDQTLPQEINK